MLPKPEHLGPEYAAQFADESVARAYPARLPYPEEVIAKLAGLTTAPRTALDLGCGTGDVARPLAARLARVVAVDPSAAMVRVGRTLPGGDAANLEWTVASAEHFSYPERYGLVVAAESLHWMEWELVLPRIAAALAPGACLALVIERETATTPWDEALRALIARWSTNRRFQPYHLLDELGSRGLYRIAGRLRTPPVAHHQTLAAYVESFHSRNGLSRERMGAGAEAFDAELKHLLRAHGVADAVPVTLTAELAWGLPA